MTSTVLPLRDGTIRIDSSGKPQRILKVFKSKAWVCGELGGRMTKPVAEVAAWEEAEIPSHLKKGELVYFGEELVTVTSFQRLGSAGFWVGLTGRWGFEEGHEHENLTPASQAHFFANLIYRRPNK